MCYMWNVWSLKGWELILGGIYISSIGLVNVKIVKNILLKNRVSMGIVLVKNKLFLYNGGFRNSLA